MSAPIEKSLKLGVCIILIILIYIDFFGRYFPFYILDKTVCPFLVKTYDITIWHPTNEMSLDELLGAHVDV